MEKISVVLPTYNGEKYLKESIESVMNQTYINWELIIVDDHSSDTTLEIAQSYASRDKRIRVISNATNQKLPKSLNIGFREAQGDYLTWTSDDNLYLPEAFQKMVDYLHQYNVPMVCTQMEILDVEQRREFPAQKYNELEMYLQNSIGACFLYRKAVLSEVGEYDENRFLVEDYDYWLRILQKYEHIGFLEQNCYKYRTHGGSLSTTRQEAVNRQRAILQRDNIDWLIQINPPREGVVQIYYEMIAAGVMTKEVQLKVQRIVQELKNERKLEEHKPIVIYGGGKYGDLAYKELKGNDVICYVDRNEMLNGTYKNGILILGLDELRKLLDTDEVQILISVMEDKIFSVMNTLSAIGVHNWSVLQSI